jgi:hypothetical protein
MFIIEIYAKRNVTIVRLNCLPKDFGFVVPVLKGMKGPKPSVLFVTIQLVT